MEEERAVDPESTVKSERAAHAEGTVVAERAVAAEGTAGSERAGPYESAVTGERADELESTEGPERAVGDESTVAPERAAYAESTAASERAVGKESTVVLERAVAPESTVTSERAVFSESTGEEERAAEAESTEGSEHARPDPKPARTPRRKIRVLDAKAIVRKLLRDRACRSCGKPTGNAHHLVQKGAPFFGDDTEDNIVGLCGTGTSGCHGAMHGTPYVDEHGERWDQARVAAAIGRSLTWAEVRYVIRKIDPNRPEAGEDFLRRTYHLDTGGRDE